MKHISVEAISLHGSSEPGSFAVMEYVFRFTLDVDPPEVVKPNLPPGIQKGDSSGMVMLATIWWNGEGEIARELEYGKPLWEGFDIKAFNEFWENKHMNSLLDSLSSHLNADRSLGETRVAWKLAQSLH